MLRFKAGDRHSPIAGSNVESPYNLSPVGQDVQGFLSPKMTQRKIARSPFKVSFINAKVSSIISIEIAKSFHFEWDLRFVDHTWQRCSTPLRMLMTYRCVLWANTMQTKGSLQVELDRDRRKFLTTEWRNYKACGCAFSPHRLAVCCIPLCKSSSKVKDCIADQIYEQVLDAPHLQDDFYLNLVDWSSQNVLAVGLGSCVYLWSASTSKVSALNLILQLGAHLYCDWLRALIALPLSCRIEDNPFLVASLNITCKLCPSKLSQNLPIPTRRWFMYFPLSSALTGTWMQVTKLCDLGGEEDESRQSSPDTVCSVSWSQKGTYLSVGTDSGRALIWDIAKTSLWVALYTIWLRSIEAFWEIHHSNKAYL